MAATEKRQTNFMYLHRLIQTEVRAHVSARPEVVVVSYLELMNWRSLAHGMFILNSTFFCRPEISQILSACQLKIRQTSTTELRFFQLVSLRSDRLHAVNSESFSLWVWGQTGFTNWKCLSIGGGVMDVSPIRWMKKTSHQMIEFIFLHLCESFQEEEMTYP